MLTLLTMLKILTLEQCLECCPETMHYRLRPIPLKGGITDSSTLPLILYAFKFQIFQIYICLDVLASLDFKLLVTESVSE